MKKTLVVVSLLALAAAFSGSAQATPLEEIHSLPVSRLEFSSLKLEVALDEIKDWPFPIEGANVSFQVDPDLIEIRVALTIAPDASFRTACGQTLARVRKLLYVDANGIPRMGRSDLGSYFRGPWSGPQREAILRTLDTTTRIRVDVVKRGTCKAALIKAPVTFEPNPPN
jgi:hypothetical protein